MFLVAAEADMLSLQKADAIDSGGVRDVLMC